MRFRDLLAAIQNKNNSTLAIGLAPSLVNMPQPVAHFDDPFLPFGKLVINTTRELVCAYVFHLGAYLSVGASGAVALERTIAYVPAGIVKILHGPFASADYASAAFEDGFGADAVTYASSYELSHIAIAPYLHDKAHGIYVQAIPGVPSPPSFGKLTRDYPDQFGLYYPAGDSHIELNLYSEPSLITRWYWKDSIYPSRGDDFQDALYTAAAALSLSGKIFRK